jgi:phenylalanyl-tRNA synthetase beta chain
VRVPLAWLREYVDLPQDAQKVAEMLAEIGFPVEAIEERPVITGVVVGRIAELEKHPNADRLQVGRIDAGNGGLLTIATAATNVAQGQTIAVATIGAQLPQLKIERRKMRGIESEGMMISAEELALPGEWFEDGIMQFEPTLDPGTDVIEYFRLSEAVLDVEITSNRVDAMCIVGLARELAAYQGVALRLPATPEIAVTLASRARVTIESPDCLQFALQEFSNVRPGRSPAWMRIRLALAGQRPINSLVDISNYVMLEMGQPTHFYDAAKIPHKHLIVRDALPGERLRTLDGAEHELDAKDLLIASERAPEGFAGLMGGADSEVTDATTSILLEAATFAGARVRRMSARHGFRSEASSRHEKALPPALAQHAAARAAELLIASGASAGPLTIEGSREEPAAIELKVRDVRRLLGYDLSATEIREYLDRLGFATSPIDAVSISVRAPWWRRDVTMAADVVEEIARMAGYDRIESRLPAVPSHEISSDDYDLERRIASSLCALGYHEIVTYSLTGRQAYDKLDRAGLQPTLPYVEVLNPLSEDQRYLRSSLAVSHVQYLARIGEPRRIFEIAHIFYNEGREPMESPLAVFAFSAHVIDEPAWRDTHFLRLKSDVLELLGALTGRRDIDVTPDTRNGLHPGKTAAALLDGRELANFGQLHPQLCALLGMESPVYGCVLFVDRVPEYQAPLYRAPSRYPSTYRDLALICDLDVPAVTIERTISAAIGSTCIAVQAFDEYRGSQIPPDKKSLAVRVTLQKTDATITDPEADELVARALAELADAFGITLRT